MKAPIKVLLWFQVLFLILSLGCNESGLHSSSSGQRIADAAKAPEQERLDTFYWEATTRSRFRIFVERQPFRSNYFVEAYLLKRTPGQSASQLIENEIQKVKDELDEVANESFIEKIESKRSSFQRNGLDVTQFVGIQHRWLKPDPGDSREPLRYMVFRLVRLVSDGTDVWLLKSDWRNDDHQNCIWIMDTFEKLDFENTYQQEFEKSGLKYPRWVYTWDEYDGDSVQAFFERGFKFKFDGDDKTAYLSKDKNMVILNGRTRHNQIANSHRISAIKLAKWGGFSGFAVHEVN